MDGDENIEGFVEKEENEEDRAFLEDDGRSETSSIRTPPKVIMSMTCQIDNH